MHELVVVRRIGRDHAQHLCDIGRDQLLALAVGAEKKRGPRLDRVDDTLVPGLFRAQRTRSPQAIASVRPRSTHEIVRPSSERTG